MGLFKKEGQQAASEGRPAANLAAPTAGDTKVIDCGDVFLAVNAGKPGSCEIGRVSSGYRHDGDGGKYARIQAQNEVRADYNRKHCTPPLEVMLPVDVRGRDALRGAQGGGWRLLSLPGTNRVLVHAKHGEVVFPFADADLVPEEILPWLAETLAMDLRAFEDASGVTEWRAREAARVASLKSKVKQGMSGFVAQVHRETANRARAAAALAAARAAEAEKEAADAEARASADASAAV